MPKVNPKILLWARETAGFTIEEATKKLSIRQTKEMSAVDKLIALEEGKREPTRPMLVQMAKKYHKSLLNFYMTAPPQKGDRGQDFRSLPENYSIAEDALLDVLIRDIKVRQSMIRAVLEDEEEAYPIPFIASANMSDGISSVLKSIQETLNVDINKFRTHSSPSDAFAFLRSKVEAVGVFVLLIGDLGSHHTTIDLDLFRGFALADDVAPFIIINDHDSHAAWSFTLLHELTHLWLGQTGVSGLKGEGSIEKFCNDVAGEFLLSKKELEELEINDAMALETSETIITAFAQNYNLSSSMVVYKLYRNGIIKLETWQKLSSAFREKWILNRSKQREIMREQNIIIPYYTVRRHRVGTALIELVQRMMVSGALTTSKAGKVLGVKSKNVQNLIDKGHPHLVSQ